MATAAAAVIASARRAVVRHLREAGATAAGHAVAYEPGRRIQRRQLDRLVDVGAVVETAPGTYYLDEAVYEAQRSRRKRIAGAVIGGIVAVGAAVALLA